MAFIQKALLERRRLDIRYYSMSRDEENRRQVAPYNLTCLCGRDRVRGVSRVNRSRLSTGKVRIGCTNT